MVGNSGAVGVAFIAGARECAQFARACLRQRNRRAGKHQRNLAAEEIAESVRDAFVWHMHELYMRKRIEHFAGEMQGAAASRRAVE